MRGLLHEEIAVLRSCLPNTPGREIFTDEEFDLHERLVLRGLLREIESVDQDGDEIVEYHATGLGALALRLQDASLATWNDQR